MLLSRRRENVKMIRESRGRDVGISVKLERAPISAAGGTSSRDSVRVTHVPSANLTASTASVKRSAATGKVWKKRNLLCSRNRRDSLSLSLSLSLSVTLAERVTVRGLASACIAAGKHSQKVRYRECGAWS